MILRRIERRENSTVRSRRIADKLGGWSLRESTTQDQRNMSLRLPQRRRKSAAIWFRIWCKVLKEPTNV